MKLPYIFAALVLVAAPAHSQEQQSESTQAVTDIPTMGDLRRAALRADELKAQSKILEAEVSKQSQEVALKMLRNQLLEADTAYLEALNNQALLAQQLGVQIINGRIVPLPAEQRLAPPQRHETPAEPTPDPEQEPTQPLLSRGKYPSIKSVFGMEGNYRARLQFPDGRKVKVVVGDEVEGIGTVTNIDGSSVVLKTTSNELVTLTYKNSPSIVEVE